MRCSRAVSHSGHADEPNADSPQLALPLRWVPQRPTLILALPSVSNAQSDRARTPSLMLPQTLPRQRSSSPFDNTSPELKHAWRDRVSTCAVPQLRAELELAESTMLAASLSVFRRLIRSLWNAALEMFRALGCHRDIRVLLRSGGSRARSAYVVDAGLVDLTASVPIGSKAVCHCCRSGRYHVGLAFCTRAPPGQLDPYQGDVMDGRRVS